MPAVACRRSTRREGWAWFEDRGARSAPRSLPALLAQALPVPATERTTERGRRGIAEYLSDLRRIEVRVAQIFGRQIRTHRIVDLREAGALLLQPQATSPSSGESWPVPIFEA
eukprot:TRINITY_DN65948_c0_g1_i1.p2 TRINITY_DN65948_c0_g1~~TRINITY_DN65948_c0_g1_i1.p2  ORF type:complete len:113 (+),score=7.66 TRINITY_DN65948_c0_g1_i1:102-440(+)